MELRKSILLFKTYESTNRRENSNQERLGTKGGLMNEEKISVYTLTNLRSTSNDTLNYICMSTQFLKISSHQGNMEKKIASPQNLGGLNASRLSENSIKANMDI